MLCDIIQLAKGVIYSFGGEFARAEESYEEQEELFPDQEQ